MSENLKNELNLLDIFCISTGAMISSGLFIIPGIAFAKAGPAVILAYIIAGIFCLPTLFSMAELTTAMPKAGGAYFYIMRGFGPLLGTIAGISTWFSLCLKGAFALIGVGTYLAILTDMPIQAVAIICCIVFTVINLLGTKEASRFQVIMVLVLIGILLAYIGLGAPHVTTTNFTPFFSKGYEAVFTTASFVFISYGGLVKIAALAEETKNPEKKLPLAMILSLITTTVIYALVIFVTIGVSDQNALKTSLTPISLGASYFSGSFFTTIVISIGALLAFIPTANSAIMAGSRYPLGMSRDKILPAFFQKVSKKSGTPYPAVLVTGFIVILFILLPLETLVKVASSLIILIFILSNFTVILFKESRISSYKPTFKSPLYPYMQVFGILGGGLLLAEMGTLILFLTMVFVAFGFLWYVFYSKRRSAKDSALIYLLTNLVAQDKEFASENLLDELKDIIIQRDEVIMDKVHRLFENSIVLDFDEPIEMEEFFKSISEKIGAALGIDHDNIYNKFLEREKEACTVMRKGLAIPHIIIDGENIFKILMARSKGGVRFQGDKRVQIIFATVSSADKRDLHLKVLAAIAQITENPAFDKQWLDVANKEELKHIVLLAERRRG